MATCIALAGNPNCGKTTMFNELTGANQYVGNWPGVTVEKKQGDYTGNKEVKITDLPGIYSLSPYSPEEIVARDYLLSKEPNVVVNIVDASNLERNLYLTAQILELGLPVIIALNMMDLVEKNGDTIDIKKLEYELGCPVVATSALKGRGMDDVVKQAIDIANKDIVPTPRMRFSDTVETALAKIIDILGDHVSSHVLRWYAIKLFENDERTRNELSSKLSAADFSAIETIRSTVEQELDDDAESIITADRYDEITKVIDKTLTRSHKGLTMTQKIDKIVTNRVLGIPIFIVIMFFVYWLAVSIGGGVVTDWANDGISGDGWLYTGTEAYDAAVAEWEGEQANIEAYLETAAEEGIDTEDVVEALEAEEPTSADEVIIKVFIEETEDAEVVAEIEDEESGEVFLVDSDAFAAALEVDEPDPSAYGLWIPGLTPIISDAMEAAGTAAWVQSLVVDGIVAGVGAVIGFIPQMIILFLLLGILELCGYMSRVAFIMDRIFRRFGLSGKSFIPMLIASGCGVPAVMATKTIESENDRRMTIMTTTMIPCGAKMPIIALVFGALAAGDSDATWWVAPLFYFLGVAAIITSGIMLKKLKAFAGATAPFIMELPQYHLPTVKGVLFSVWERVKSYVVKAGTIIFLSTIVIWFLMNFGTYDGQFGLLDAEMDGYLDYSIMAGLGGVLSWLFTPLGFDNWESTVTSITGLVAKENVVATVGIITQLGELNETDPSLWDGFAAMLGGGSAAIVAFCAFNLLCAPCFAAIGTIRRQMMSAKWTWATIGYMTSFGWLVGMMLYQFVGLALGEVSFNVWTVVAIVVLLAILFQLFRPMPNYDDAKHKGKNVLSSAEKNAT